MPVTVVPTRGSSRQPAAGWRTGRRRAAERLDDLRVKTTARLQPRHLPADSQPPFDALARDALLRLARRRSDALGQPSPVQENPREPGQLVVFYISARVGIGFAIMDSGELHFLGEAEGWDQLTVIPNSAERPRPARAIAKRRTFGESRDSRVRRPRPGRPTHHSRTTGRRWLTVWRSPATQDEHRCRDQLRWTPDGTTLALVLRDAGA
jgi:hypothetical protein